MEKSRQHTDNVKASSSCMANLAKLDGAAELLVRERLAERPYVLNCMDIIHHPCQRQSGTVWDYTGTVWDYAA
jgi:hypothetical protein